MARIHAKKNLKVANPPGIRTREIYWEMILSPIFEFAFIRAIRGSVFI